MNTGDPDRRSLDRVQKLPRPIRFLRARIRLLTSIAAGLLVLMLLPQAWRWTSRALVAWDVTVVLYLATAYLMMQRTDTSHIRSHAIAADDGRVAILFLTAGAALASLLAIVVEIGASHRGTTQILLAIVTIALSWAMVHTTFALNYAHDYYRPRVAGGLKFSRRGEARLLGFRLFLVRHRHDRTGLRRRDHRSRHPPDGDRARHRLVRLQHRIAGADGEHRGGCALTAADGPFRHAPPAMHSAQIVESRTGVGLASAPKALT